MTMRFLVVATLSAALAAPLGCGSDTTLFGSGGGAVGGGATGGSATGAGGASSSGTGGTASGGGGGGECGNADECPQPGTLCVEAGCVGGSCVVEDAPAGTPCGNGYQCNGKGQCLAVAGELCGTPAECLDGLCVDGVCCESACDGTCESCAEPGSEGSCTPVAAAHDPDAECGGGVCDGAGACAEGEHLWSKRFGDGSRDYSFRVAVDAAGNSVIVGYFFGSIDFGGGTLTTAGNWDVFVAKFDTNGNHLWSKRFGDSSWDYGWGVALDPAGNVLLTGYFFGTIDFGGGAMTSAGQRDLFVAKLDPNGDFLWSKRFGDANEEWCRSIASDSAGNVLLGGWFFGSINFGGGQHNSAGGSDVFVAKLDPNGGYLSSAHYGGIGDQRLYGLAVDPADNVLLTGYFFNTIDFGSGTGVLSSAGDRDLFVAKIDPNGVAQWSQRAGDTVEQYGRSVASDGAGNVLLTGYFMGGMDLGGGVMQSAGQFDTFVAKLDSSGTHLWSKRFGNSGNQLGQWLVTDGGGNVVLVGSSVGTIDFGGGPLGTGNSTEAFALKLSAGGDHLWSKLYDGADVQVGYGVGVDGPGNVYLTGYFRNAIDLGGGSMASAGFDDAFLAKLSP